MYLKFYLENQRMPIEDEVNDICKRLFTAVQSFAPKTEYEKFGSITNFVGFPIPLVALSAHIE